MARTSPDESIAAPNETAPKKPRKRKLSQYVVFKTELDGSGEGPVGTITQVAEGNSIKQCRERIETDRIVGKLMICTVRQRLEASVQEVFKFS